MSTAFGDNLLPTDSDSWKCTDASITSAGISIQSGGSASTTFTSLNGTNLLPTELKIEALASNYGYNNNDDTAIYRPSIFICVRIIFEDNNAFDARLPVTNIDNGFRAILHPTISNYEAGVSAYSSITFSVYSAVDTVLSPITFRKSLSDVLVEDKNYYGIQISTENGLKIWREDGLAEAIFNGDTFSMRSKDDQGNMTDAIYFDALERKYKLSGNVIVEGAIASDSVFTDSLYAERGDVSELTVDELTTSRFVLKYLALDYTDDNFQHLFSDEDGIPHHEWVSSETIRSVVSNYNTVRLKSGNTVLFWTDDTMVDTTTTNTGYPAYAEFKQCTNTYGEKLYWAKNIYDTNGSAMLNNRGYPVDSAGNQIYTTTSVTSWPVYVFKYKEMVKATIQFEKFTINNKQAIMPVIVLGAGDGTGAGNNQVRIYKDNDQLMVRYRHSETDITECSLNRFLDARVRRLRTCSIDTSAGTIQYTMEGSSTTEQLSFTQTDTRLIYTWPDGFITSITKT